MSSSSNALSWEREREEKAGDGSYDENDDDGGGDPLDDDAADAEDDDDEPFFDPQTMVSGFVDLMLDWVEGKIGGFFFFFLGRTCKESLNWSTNKLQPESQPSTFYRRGTRQPPPPQNEF